MMNSSIMESTNDDNALPVSSSSSAEPATTSSPTEERPRRTLSLSSCLNLWHESDGALYPPALLAAESSASSIVPGDNKNEIIILEESRNRGCAPSSSTIARPTAEQQQQPHRHRGSSSRARSASLDRLCLFDQNHRDNNDHHLLTSIRTAATMFRSVSDSNLFTVGTTTSTTTGSGCITASERQKVRCGGGGGGGARGKRELTSVVTGAIEMNSLPTIENTGGVDEHGLLTPAEKCGNLSNPTIDVPSLGKGRSGRCRCARDDGNDDRVAVVVSPSIIIGGVHERGAVNVAKGTPFDKITGGRTRCGSSNNGNNSDGSKVRSGDTTNSNEENAQSPFAATTTPTTTTTAGRQRRRKVGLRKTTAKCSSTEAEEKAAKKENDRAASSNEYYYYHHNNNNDRNKSTVLVFPTTVAVGVMLGIVVAFVAVALRRSASEIAELRSTVLKLQSTVLELQSTVIDRQSTSSTVTGEEAVIQGQTTTTMENVVEALVNLDKAVNQIESNLASTNQKRTEEPFVNPRIVGNKKSASPTVAALETLTFDDRRLTTDFDRILDGYHGLGFTNMWTGSPHLMMEDNDCIERSGLLHGRISYPAVAVNANGDPASIRAMKNDDDTTATTTSITVSSLVATPVGRNNVQLNVEGLRGSTIVRATIVTLPSTQRPMLVELEGFEDLTEIRLETVGGELVFEDCQCSPIVAFDDIIIHHRIHQPSSS